MNNTLPDLKSRYNELTGEKRILDSQLTQFKKERRELRSERRFAERAATIIQLCAQETQNQLKYQLGELPKLALSSVFGDPYEFEVEFEKRRGSVEADFWFVRDGAKIIPKRSSGLGAVDIAGIGLRISLWSLKTPRTMASIWLDEPFKHLKGEIANSRALSILSEICKPRPDQNWPGLQIVMIADERASREDLLLFADRVYEISMKGRESKIKKLK